MHSLISRATAGFTLTLVLALAAPAALLAQTPTTAAPPAAFVAPAAPNPDESNAERAKSQPGNNAPLWRAVRDGKGISNLPGAEKGVLIQNFVQYPGSRLTNAGEAWRRVRNDWIIPYGGSLVIIVLLALGIFYFTKGPVGHEHGRSGGRIERFTPFERAAHWSNATAFVVLAISGLVMAFGKFLLLPIIGGTVFGWLTYALKTMHNFVGPLFVVSLIIVFFTFLKDNFPTRIDFVWLRTAGGMFGNREVPSHRFNAGEKIVFWGGVLALGAVVVGSGLYLDKVLPGMDYLRYDMQVAHMVHGVATMLMMAMFLGHIYMGTIGMRGAYRAMRNGYVNDAWAKEHHELWYEDIMRGKIPAQRGRPAGDPEIAPVVMPR